MPKIPANPNAQEEHAGKDTGNNSREANSRTVSNLSFNKNKLSETLFQKEGYQNHTEKEISDILLWALINRLKRVTENFSSNL